jgi:uncharacterized membrane protein
MYSQGILLASVTAWLLLRALRPGPRRGLWWSAYAVAVAAFCYTHYFAFFTIAAQAAFVVADLLLRARQQSFRGALASVAGLLYAGAVAFILYAPWLPVFRIQQRAGWQGFCVPHVTVREVERTLFELFQRQWHN